MKRALQIVFILVFASLFVIGCTGPDGDPGDPGAPGLDGSPGPSVYLMDQNGIRYYSGATIYLGFVRYLVTPDQSLSTELTIVNESNSDITIGGAPDVTLLIEMMESSAGNITYDIDGTPSSDAMSIDYSTLSNSLPANSSSEPITFTIDCTLTYRNLKETRRYLIEMTDGTVSYDFVFEAYGFILDSGGW